MQTTSPKRPQLTREQAEQFHYLEVLKRTGPAGAEYLDPWDPLQDSFMIDGGAVVPDYRVAGDGEIGVLQRAVDVAVRDALASGRTDRIYIELGAGLYRGLVYVPALVVNGVNVPITLFAASDDPASTVITETIDAEMPATDYAQIFGDLFAQCHDTIKEIHDKICTRSGIITTANASVVRVENHGFQMKGLSVRNGYNADRVQPGRDDGPRNAAGQFTTGQHQAVAVLIAGADKVHLDHVHLSSYQDTLYFQGPAPAVTARSFYSHCYIEGDVDFIFGQTTAYFWECEIKSLGSRAQHSWVCAPSTNIRTPYGVVFQSCTFTHDNSDTALAGHFNLGRQWFEGVRCTPYGTSPIDGYACELGDISQFDGTQGTISVITLESVGKCAVLNCKIGAHINTVAPWANWNGGTFDLNGTYTPAPWSARYRPTLYSAQDFIDGLSHWAPMASLDFSDIDQNETFLAEFESKEISLK